MKFKLDENLPAETAADLRALGHDAQTVAAQGLAGAKDGALLDCVRHEGRVLLTMDKGIADIRRYPPADYPGIVLVRPGRRGRESVAAFIRKHLPRLLRLHFDGSLCIVSETGIRKR